MKERPILFSAAMVRAILSGAKTQTRRIAKPKRSMEPMSDECPYGQTGDRLWVRETWADVNTEGGPAFTYRADANLRFCSADAFPVEYDRYPGMNFAMWCSDLWSGSPGHGWRPSIHMPRWACRLVLEITDVRVERLQAISEADALAEGVALTSVEGFERAGMERPAGFAFRDLWTSTGGDWDSNPWVWVIEFKRITP